MADQVVTVTVKGIGDFSDVVSNVGSIQKALTKLKLPDKLGDNLNKNIDAFYKEYEKYQKKISEGVKTQGDYNQVEKSLNNMRNLYQAIGKDAQKLLKLDMKDLLDLDTGEFKKITSEITNIMKQIGNVKIDTTSFKKAADDIRGITKNTKISGDNGILNQIMGSIQTGQIADAKRQFQELQNYANKVAPRMLESGKQAPGTLSVDKYQQLTAALAIMSNAFTQADAAMAPFIAKENELQKELEETKQKAAQGIEKDFKGYGQATGEVEKLTDSLKRMHQEEFSFNRETQNLDRQIQSYFGLSQMIRKVGDIAKDAFATVKELDAAMTQTAVVTNYDVGDMWNMLPTYTEQANQLGSTIKDVYEAATLYYQQGLNTNQAMGLANETLKMARIAGLGAAEATDMMTAALRGFNMEINQQSAQKINDIYSELAAITASDTQEIGSAMERTASIANSANMEFETTSAFLAQMIETTREAPENLGTAMKTIVARFQEMKQDPTKLVDSEGVAMDANKVDKALKTIGVQLMNTKGEFRDLDDVFLDISAKWDSLTQGQQRYIATIAAGSRQQSRFIAMMSNYERTMELVDAANNSAGASQRQFEKTLDSMSSKLNMLKNAWDQFTMGLMNNQILKFGVDALTKGFTIINKFIDILGKIPPKPFEGITKSILTLVTTLGMLNLGKKGARGLIMGGAAWFKGEEGGFGKNFMTGFSGQAAKAGATDGQAYVQNFNNALKRGQLKEAFNLTKNRAQSFGTQPEYENTFQAAFGQFSAKELSAGWSPQIESEIRNAFVRASASVDASVWGQEDGNEYIEGLITKMRSGQMSAAEAANSLHIRTQGQTNITNMGVNALPTKQVDELNNALAKAGSSLQMFGMALQNTPLAPFGALLSKIGMLVTGFGGAIGTVAAASAAAVGYFVSAWAAGTPIIIASLKAIGIGFKTLFAEMGPIGWAILAIMGLVAAAKGIDAIWESQAEKIEAATNAAAAASDAYDSVKQETSELADSIAQIEETDAAFDNLVAGTAEFNEKLITANEQISELLDKYPMLNDPKYLSTDKNGRMRINQAGLDAVKEYQKQIQANASAMNLIQTADLNALQNQQKADDLRKTKSGMTSEDVQKNSRDADLLEQRIKAETELARQNAIRVSLADKEIHSAETMSKIMADQYEIKRESAEIDVDNMSKHERRQAYADFHGYTYEKATKKIKDIEGNEVDYDDDVIKDEVIEQQVILEFQEDADSLERALSSANSKFAAGLEEQTAGSAHVISDILSSNIETDEEVLKKVLSEPDKLQNLVDSLSESEMAAILGISASSITDSNENKYKDEIVEKLTDKATNIAEAQAESYAELGTMMAKAQGNILDKNGDIIGQKDKNNKQIEEAISKQISDLKPDYAHLMSSVGSQLQEFAGEDTMAAFVNEAYKIYTAKGENASETISELNGLLNNTNFDSAISRLTFYNKAMKSSNANIQKIGKAMKKTTGEANLLGKAFDEFLGSSDWAELSENADNFKNSLGEYDAAGIQAAAEQSRTLKELLDSGAISAGGVAAALQGMDDGTITNLNSTVLTLLSSFNRLADVASEAHKVIEGFDPGIDTGEGEDFVKENAEKFKEYYDNGEFGNEQLQNYIKLAAGTEEWNKALRKNGGDLRETAKDLKYYVTAFDEGFVPVYDKLTQGLDLKGNKISDKVKKEFEGLEFLWDENGELQINLADFGTEDLQLYLQKALGISEEYAKLMLQNLANYDTKLSSELRANDIKKSLSDKDFQKGHQDNQGRFTLSDSDIRAVGANLELKHDINTPEGFEEATKALEELAGVELQVFKTQNDDGSQREDYDKLLTDYAKTFYGKETKDLFGIEDLQQGGKFDVGKLVNDSIAKGMDSNQASQVAYEAVKEASSQGFTELLYNGQLLDLSEIGSYDDFLAATQKITDSAQWYEVGQSIAQGIISYINGKENPDKTETGSSEKGSEKGSDSDSKKDSKDKDTSSSSSTPTYEETYRSGKDYGSDQSFSDVIAGIGRWFNTNPVTGEVRDTSTTTDTSSTSTTEQQDSLNSAATSLSEAATALSDAGTNLSNAATALNTDNQNQDGKGVNVNENNLQTPETLAIDVTANIQDVTPPSEEPTIPVKADLQVEGSNSGGFLSKIFGGGKGGPSIDVAANVTTINTNAQAKTVDIVGNITKIESTSTAKSINATATVTKVTKAPQVAGEPISVKATATATQVKNDTKTPKVSAGTQTMNVTANTSAAQAKINQLISLFNKTYTLKYTASGPRSISVPISANFTGPWQKTVTINKSGAKGINNRIGYYPMPTFGSVARGKYGTLGPKDRGGLTLTGEKGFEIAWLPNENRSMILGANGPQMLNLPSDAVVYTHEQSKKIMKQQAILAGSHANTSIRRPGSSSSSVTNTGRNVEKSAKKAAKAVTDTAAKVGYVSVWWENIARKTEASQRKMDQNQKAFEKYIKEMRITLRQTGESLANGGGGGNAYLKSITNTIGYYEAQLKRANKELSTLNVGTAKQQKAAKTSSKKDDKKANKAAYNSGAASAVKISYKKGKKSKEEIVNLAPYIKAENGTYVVDQAKLNKIKNKDRRQAIADAANKEINDRISKRNSDEDAIEKAREALEKFGEELYNTFFKWKNELTKVWNITQKIEATEAKIGRAKGYSDLLTSQLSTGLQQAGVEFSKETLKAFTTGIDNQRKQVEQTLTSIGEKRNNLNKLLSVDDEKTTLTNIQNKLINDINADAKIQKAVNNQSKKKSALDKANKTLSKEQSNKKALEKEKKELLAQKKKAKSSKQKKKIQNKINAIDNKINKSNNNIKKYQSQVKTAKAAYNAATENVKTVKEQNKSANLNATQKLGYETYAKELEKQINAQVDAWKYLSVEQFADGTIDLSFDTAAFEKAQQAGNISEELGKYIQDYANQLIEATKELNEEYENVTSQMNDMYESLETLQDQWTDYAKELWDMADEQTKKEIDNAKKLNDALTKALKNLIDQVKKKLDQRREQEDNAKTEKDISQKQQRLAMLRADTSGGHQVEIAQLEKEIAEAQQSYQRTLEDQLINKLQDQADLAAEQRERQIELLESISEATNNAELVDLWMANPELYRNEMWEAYKTKNKYDKSPKAIQDNLRDKFNVMYDGLLNNQKEQKYVKEQIGYLTTQKGILDTISETLNSIAANAPSTTVNGGTGVTEGGTAAKEAATEKANQPASSKKSTGSKSTTNNAAVKKAYSDFLAARGNKGSKDKYKGKLGKDGLKAQIDRGKKIGKSEMAVLQDLTNTAELNWTKVLKAYIDLKGRKTAATNIKKYFGNSPSSARKTGWKGAFGKAYPKYAAGGMADFTGPAWMDGTPSKPELVLDAQDTKNFIALKDVLSHAVGATSGLGGNYGDMTYEININVEKLTSDYDVDKVADRVKKIIVKDASYRNVTQVRKFR